MNGPKRPATSGLRSVRGCHGPAPRYGAPRSGFTLVELLVVITIIGMLAGMALIALNAARTTARIAKTKAVIKKLDLLVQQQYDSYRTRRVTIYETTSGSMVRLNPGSLGNPTAAAYLRMHAIRDLMRMEMPERWFDIRHVVSGVDLANPAPIRLYFGTPSMPTPQTREFVIKRPSLSAGYLRRLPTWPAPLPGGSYDSAECLYMWVTRAIPEAREQFADNEVGDADGDTYPEFIDGWGNPIKFLRWAPAFRDSDVQPTVLWDPPPVTDAANRAARAAASEIDHDPFDSRKLDIDADPTNVNRPPRGGWRLVPLIYSAGPDGIYGLSTGGDYSYDNKNASAAGQDCEDYGPNPFYEWDTGSSSFKPSNIGGQLDITTAAGRENVAVIGPKEVNGVEDYLDNIHNHRAEED